MFLSLYPFGSVCRQLRLLVQYLQSQLTCHHKDVPDFLSSVSSCRSHEEILFCSSMISLMHSVSFRLMLNLVYRVQHTSSTASLRSDHSSLTIFRFVRFYNASWSWILPSSYFKNSVPCFKLDDCPSLEDWVLWFLFSTLYMFTYDLVMVQIGMTFQWKSLFCSSWTPSLTVSWWLNSWYFLASTDKSWGHLWVGGSVGIIFS